MDLPLEPHRQQEDLYRDQSFENHLQQLGAFGPAVDHSPLWVSLRHQAILKRVICGFAQ